MGASGARAERLFLGPSASESRGTEPAEIAVYVFADATRARESLAPSFHPTDTHSPHRRSRSQCRRRDQGHERWVAQRLQPIERALDGRARVCRSRYRFRPCTTSAVSRRGCVARAEVRRHHGRLARRRSQRQSDSLCRPACPNLRPRPIRIGPRARAGSTRRPFCRISTSSRAARRRAAARAGSIKARHSSPPTWRAASEGQSVPARRASRSTMACSRWWSIGWPRRRRQRSLQYRTRSQHEAHFFRQAKGRPQAGQSLLSLRRSCDRRLIGAGSGGSRVTRFDSRARRQVAPNDDRPVIASRSRSRIASGPHRSNAPPTGFEHGPHSRRPRVVARTGRSRAPSRPPTGAPPSRW